MHGRGPEVARGVQGPDDIGFHVVRGLHSGARVGAPGDHTDQINRHRLTVLGQVRPSSAPDVLTGPEVVRDVWTHARHWRPGQVDLLHLTRAREVVSIRPGAVDALQDGRQRAGDRVPVGRPAHVSPPTSNATATASRSVAGTSARVSSQARYANRVAGIFTSFRSHHRTTS